MSELDDLLNEADARGRNDIERQVENSVIVNALRGEK